MSEFWVSKKKYWCTYCECFIADDKPSRTQHENGLRHQGNKERYVRQIYKTGEKRKRDLEEEKREMAVVDRAAQAAYAQDIASGRASASSLHSSASTSTQSAAAAAAPKPLKAVSKWANYTTAAQLGYEDEEAKRAAAIAEQRSKEGTVGAWEVVVPPPPSAPPPPPLEHLNNIKTQGGGDEAEVDVKPLQKKEKEIESLPFDEDDSRNYRVRQKKAPMFGKGIGKLYDPGEIIIKKKQKVEEQTEVPPPSVTVEEQTLEGSSKTDPEPESSNGKGGWQTLDEQVNPTKVEPRPRTPQDGPVPEPELKNGTAQAPEPTLKPEETEAKPVIEAKEESLPPSLEQDAPSTLFRPRKVKRPINPGTSRRGGRF